MRNDLLSRKWHFVGAKLHWALQCTCRLCVSVWQDEDWVFGTADPLFVPVSITWQNTWQLLTWSRVINDYNPFQLWMFLNRTGSVSKSGLIYHKGCHWPQTALWRPITKSCIPTPTSSLSKTMTHQTYKYMSVRHV